MARHPLARALRSAVLGVAVACAGAAPPAPPETLPPVAAGPSDPALILHAALVPAYGELRDGELREYVAGVGRRLLGASGRRERDHRFTLLDRPEPMAFSIPMGHVYVSRGLLAMANDESELAAVLARELARLEQVGEAELAGLREAAQGAQRLLLSEQSELILPLNLPVLELAFREEPVDRELHLDRRAEEIAARAGYEPGGLARLLHTYDRLWTLGLDAPPRAYYEPPPVIDARLSGAPLEPGAHAEPESRQRYLRQLEGTTVGPDPRNGQALEDGRFVHLERGYQLDLPADWLLVQSRDTLVALRDGGAAALFVTAIRGLPIDRPDGVPFDEVARRLADLYQEEEGLELRHSRMPLAGQPSLSFTYRPPGGQGLLRHVWVAHQGELYLLSGATTGLEGGLSFARHRTAFGPSSGGGGRRRPASCYACTRCRTARRSRGSRAAIRPRRGAPRS